MLKSWDVRFRSDSFVSFSPGLLVSARVDHGSVAEVMNIFVNSSSASDTTHKHQTSMRHVEESLVEDPVDAVDAESRG